MSYSERYRTPSPLFPAPSPTTLERLLETWESLRLLDTEGYRTSSAEPMSTWLVQINWADGRVSPRSPGRGTTCSPFVTQSIAMAYGDGSEEPYSPRLAGGEALPLLFCRAANSNMSSAHQKEMERYGMTLQDNGWPRPLIFFNMASAVDITQMRRGDAVHIDWASGGGHAVFCWDVHLNSKGEVDAFQFVSSNGRITVNGTNAGAGAGVSVGGTPLGDRGFIRQTSTDPLRYESLRQPLFVDDERYVAEGTWVTWNPHLKMSDLADCRVRPRGRLALAKKVMAARLHGVVPPEPFAMSAAPPRQVPVEREEDEGSVSLLQQRLGLIHAVGWIDVDPGEPDGIFGRHTKEAVRAFQRAYDLTPDGIAGPRTHAKLREIYQAACETPDGKSYLATGSTDESERDPGEEIVAFYFRHGVARADAMVPLVVVAHGLDGKRLTARLRDSTTGAVRGEPLILEISNGRAVAQVPCAGLSGARLVAAIEERPATTLAPLLVL